MTATPSQSPQRVSGTDRHRTATLIWPMLAVTLLGLALRLYNLDHESVGFDEAFSMTACGMPMPEMMRTIIQDFVHPPLHYLVLRGWLDVFGFSVLSARMLSVLFGTLAIPLLYGLANYLFDRTTALYAALLLAISQLGIMFGQEARPYAQFLFLFLACCWVFIRALRERSGRLWCGFVCLAALLIYTHYFGFLALGALVLFAFLFRKQYSVPAWWWIVGAAVTVAAYIPWMTSGILHAALNAPKTLSGKASFWSVDASTFFTAINFFNNGKPAGLLGSSPLWTVFAGGLLFSAPAALSFYAARDKRERQNAVLVTMLWVLPLLGAIAAGYAHFQYNVRYVAFCAAPYYILVGRGLAAVKPSVLRAVLICLLLGYTANSLRANYYMPRKEDFRAAAAYIDSRRLAGDCGVFFPGFHVPAQWNIVQNGASPFRVLLAEDLPSGLNSCSRIWAISWSISGNPWQWARAHEQRQPLEATHAKIAGRDFFWVHVALFSRKQP